MRKPVLLLCFLLAIFQAQRVCAQNRQMTERTLRDHGVNATPAGLTAFLERGWRAANPPNPLPQAPLEKSSLFIDAWNLLAMRRDEARAVPELRRRLAGLALRYARADFPPAVSSTLENDLLRLDSREVVEARARRREFLQYNGMVALAYFGEASPEVRTATRTIYDAENRPPVRITYARTLALLGDNLVLDDLLAEVAKANRDSSVLAARTLSDFFGQPYRFDANMAVGPRIEAAEKILEWWEKYRSERSGPVTVDREAAIARLLHEPPARAPSLRTLRDLLRASADKMDVADRRGSRTAADELRKRGPRLARELEPILDDPREDLDIRSEAMLWYSRLLEKKARGRLRKLLKDPNPEIADLARKYLNN